MAFTGDLEHLSIVDVIQLLHATRKTGTLIVKGTKGESQLVFSNGYIVSANHVDNHVRIGNILVEKKAISEDELHIALLDQNIAGAERKPLIAMLIESGALKRDDAYNCLETLIELTIVEIIGWKRGTFTLDVGNCAMSDEYRYFPEKLHQDIYLHTENVLMDALRMYDEKMRDRLASGEHDEDEPDDLDVIIEPIEEDEKESLTAETSQVITADDLGLGDIENIKPVNKGRFTPISDHEKMMRTRHHDVKSALPDGLHSEISSFIDTYPAVKDKILLPVSVIIFSWDEFLSICITVICKQHGICVLSINEEDDLLFVLRQSILKKSIPFVIIDDATPSGIDKVLESLGRTVEGVSLLALTSEPNDVILEMIQKNGISVFIKPDDIRRKDTFVKEYLKLLEAIPAAIAASIENHEKIHVFGLLNMVNKIRGIKNPLEAVDLLLGFVSGFFGRSVVFALKGTELTSSRSIGIVQPLNEISGVLRVSVNIEKESIFDSVLSGGGYFWGIPSDANQFQKLYGIMEKPLNEAVFIVPIKSSGKNLAVIYADFGASEMREVPLHILEAAVSFCSLVLENMMLKSRIQSV